MLPRIHNLKPRRPRNRPLNRPARPAARAKRKRIAPPATSAPNTYWENVAEWYDTLVGAEGSEYHQKVVLPGVLRLLHPQPGEALLDVACGQGVLCRKLLQRGARVTGIDASPALVDAARARGPAEIDYRVGDARDLLLLASETFDSAACVLAIQNIHPIRPVFESAARLLKPGGRFVLVMMHPAFRGPKETSWGWDEAAKVQYRRVDRYLVPRKTPIVAHPGISADVYTWTFHKPIELYVKASRQAGMLIDALEEWPSHKTSEPGPRAAAENTARKEIPMFLALRAVKPDKSATMTPSTPAC